MSDTVPIEGRVAPGWERVRDAFATNFTREPQDNEVGASLAVYRDGACVVDLWGGYANAARTRPWRRDTLVNVWSATKGVVAIAVAMLVDQGRLSYDDPVAKHWPEFAAAGKEAITVGQILSHQSGLNGWALPLSLDELYDWSTATSRLAAQVPFWPPGTAASYHAITYGFLAGEVIRRLTGQDVGSFVRSHLAEPLQADIFIGLPETMEPRIAEIVPPTTPAVTSTVSPAEIPGRAVGNPKMEPALPNQRAWRAAQIPAANGHATAQGLGRIYGAIGNGGRLDGARIISEEGINRMSAPRWPGPDLLLGPRVWAAGVSLNVVPNWGPDPETFGHTGWGGAFGCANRRLRLGIGYAMNHMGTQLVGNPRGASLCATIFEIADR